MKFKELLENVKADQSVKALVNIGGTNFRSQNTAECFLSWTSDELLEMKVAEIKAHCDLLLIELYK